MLKIDIRTNVDDLKRQLTALQQKEVPFATVVALTRTAGDAKDAVVEEMKRVFDRPTRWTLESMRVEPAKKTQAVPMAEVLWKDFADHGTEGGKYLRPQIEGGTRRFKRYEGAMLHAGVIPNGMFTVPGPGAEIDAHGNMSPAQIVKMLSDLRATRDATQWRSEKSRGVRKMERYWVGRPQSRAPHGVYVSRPGQPDMLVLLFVSTANYKKRLDFKGVVERTMRQRFAYQFRKALDETTSGAYGKGKPTRRRAA